MKHLSGSNHGHPASQGHPGSLDLVMQARAMRYRWFVSTFTGLSTRLTRFGSRLVARPEPDRIRNPQAFSNALSA